MKCFLKLSIRFALFAIIVGAIVAISLNTYLGEKNYYIYTDNAWDNIPSYQVLDEDSPYNIVLDQHSHTLYSDGGLTVRQNILWHIAMGYNAMFLTDHNTLENKNEIALLKEEFKDDILILQGMEWSTDRIHLNFLGIEEWDFNSINRKPTDEEIQAAISEVHRQGGVVTVNHYLWSTNKDKPTRQQFLEWGVDYFEIVNSDCYKIDYYDQESIAFCQENGLGQITGTDMHHPNLLHANSSVHGWTLLTASNFSEEAVMEQLRLKNTTVLYSSAGVPSLGDYPYKSNYIMAKPFIELGRYLRAIYIGSGKVDFIAIGISALYGFSLFAISELCRLCYILLTKKLRKNIKSNLP